VVAPLPVTEHLAFSPTKEGASSLSGNPPLTFLRNVLLSLMAQTPRRSPSPRGKTRNLSLEKTSRHGTSLLPFFFPQAKYNRPHRETFDGFFFRGRSGHLLSHIACPHVGSTFPPPSSPIAINRLRPPPLARSELGGTYFSPPPEIPLLIHHRFF